jgi:hypothetical protein
MPEYTCCSSEHVHACPTLQSVAATSMVVHDERAWRTRNAPMPEELIWENLGMVSVRRSEGKGMTRLIGLREDDKKCRLQLLCPSLYVHILNH